MKVVRLSTDPTTYLNPDTLPAYDLKDVSPCELRTLFFALGAYRDQLVDDLATQFEGRGPRHPEASSYSLEDDEFLASALYKVTRLLVELSMAALDEGVSDGRSAKYVRKETVDLV